MTAVGYFLSPFRGEKKTTPATRNKGRPWNFKKKPVEFLGSGLPFADDQNVIHGIVCGPQRAIVTHKIGVF